MNIADNDIIYMLRPEAFSPDGSTGGIEAKFDYVKSLGTTAIYPDPAPAGDDLSRLEKAAEERGMRLMTSGEASPSFRDALLDYINYTISSGEAVERLGASRADALNMLGSNETERILRLMACEEDYDAAVRKVKMLSALQYALPGVPCVLSGDEAGLAERGAGYPWGAEDPGLAHHYRMLGLLYSEHPQLADGGFELLSGRYGISDDILAFTRSGKNAAGSDETILVLANRSYGDSLADLSGIEELRSGYALELLSSEELPLDENGTPGTIHMDRLSVLVISLTAEKPALQMRERACGVICHVSSLPLSSAGRTAREFVDFLCEAGFGIWQILPLNPPGSGDSPYSSYAAFAGDPGLIDADELPPEDGLAGFEESNSWWLDDYTAYMIIKEANDDKPWFEWPDEYRYADPSEYLSSLTGREKERARELRLEQYYFDAQWRTLRSYANAKGVRIMGDLPMFMAADSADVWANKDIFRMDAEGRQRVHAGVPPDGFSDEGQDWGNPLYDWEELRRRDYGWWMKRLRQCAERYDILRVDHFRGMSEYFAIPEGGTPAEGVWQHGPGMGFFAAIERMLESEGLHMKILAEDLGYLDAGVRNLLKFSGLPGMDIWQFSADEMMEMCQNEPEKAAARAFYTGTHDNNTLIGFLTENGHDSDPEAGSDVPDELKREAEEIIRKIYESPAQLAMLQLQDVFMLGEEARMNVPGTPEGNWTWKVAGDSLSDAYPDAQERAARFRELAERTGRTQAR